MPVSFEALPVEIVDIICTALERENDRASLVNLACCSKQCESLVVPILSRIFPCIPEHLRSAFRRLFDIDDNSTDNALAGLTASEKTYLTTAFSRIANVRYLDYYTNDVRPYYVPLSKIFTSCDRIQKADVWIPTFEISDLLASPIHLISMKLEIDALVDLDNVGQLEHLMGFKHCQQLYHLCMRVPGDDAHIWQHAVRGLMLNPPPSLQTLDLAIANPVGQLLLSNELDEAQRNAHPLREIYCRHAIDDDSNLMLQAQPLELCQWLLNGLNMSHLSTLHLSFLLDENSWIWLPTISLPVLRSFGTIVSPSTHPEKIVSLLTNLPDLQDLSLWHGLGPELGRRVVPHLPSHLKTLNLICECEKTNDENHHEVMICDKAILRLLREACPKLSMLSVALPRNCMSHIDTLADWSSLRTLVAELITPSRLFGYMCPCYTGTFSTTDNSRSGDPVTTLHNAMHTALHITAIDQSLADAIFDRVFQRAYSEASDAVYDLTLRSKVRLENGTTPVHQYIRALDSYGDGLEQSLLSTFYHVRRELKLRQARGRITITRTTAPEAEAEFDGSWLLVDGTYLTTLLRSIWPEVQISLGIDEVLSIEEWKTVFTSMPFEIIASLPEE